MWLVGGLLVWIFDVEGVVQGRWRTMHWATPLSERAMGLTMLAVLLAGWKCGMADRNWSWTNVTGWVLSAFWVGDGIQLVVARAGVASQSGRAVILDGLDGDL